MDKVVVVIKAPDEKPLERFIFALRNTLEVESYNKDTRCLREAHSSDR